MREFDPLHPHHPYAALMVDVPPDDPIPAPELDVAAVEAELDDVARALDRLDDGSYGTCEVCGVGLADEVLARAPAERFCAEHQPAGRS